MASFIQHHMDKIIGTISGWDRMRFRGTLRMLAYKSGLARFLGYTGVLYKDFGAYAHAVSQRVRRASVAVAASAGRPVVPLGSPSICKEDVAREIQRRDGIKEGLICVLTAMENCGSYQLRSNGQTGHLELEHARRKCQHLYHYYQHREWGFMHVRLQPWLPLNMFIGINGREWLARQMDRAGIKYLRRDNCFVWVSDIPGAQSLLDLQVSFNWQRALGELALQVNPQWASIVGDYDIPYYWSLEESEWATDIMFHDQRELERLYPRLIRHGMEALGSGDVLKFLGHKVPLQGHVHGNFAGEVTSDLKARPEGIRIKHRVNANSVKMYNKQGTVLRVETTLNNMRDMKSMRMRADGKVAWERMRKGVGDIARRAKVSEGSNQRYLAAMSVVDSATPLRELTEDLARPVRRPEGRARGLNLLGARDAELLAAVGDGKHVLNGFRNKDLREAMFGAEGRDPIEKRRRAGRITRQIRMLRLHGLIRKVAGTHRYLVTEKGRHVISALLAAREADITKLAQAA